MEWLHRKITPFPSLLPPADSTMQGIIKYGHSSSCTYQVYKGKIIVGPEGFTAPCRSVVKRETEICFLIQGHPIKMIADNNTFESFKVLHIGYFILSSQQLYETESKHYY